MHRFRMPTLAVFFSTLCLSQAAIDAWLHPSFVLRDAKRRPVQVSGEPVSTMKTCWGCHNTPYIEAHSHHSALGIDAMTPPGASPYGTPWDTGTALFGRWEPSVYRVLTPPGDERIDMGTADFIRTLGRWHVGGGLAQRSRNGIPLADLDPREGDPETHVQDPETGDWKIWNWQESGGVEMNCFLCHLSQPDNEARIEELKAGRFKWANTATLRSAGFVERTNDGWAWNPDIFDESGRLKRKFSQMQSPRDMHCGQCHGHVHSRTDEPVVVNSRTAVHDELLNTGQIRSPQRISDSGLNIHNKDEISRPFDVHSERLITCSQCHYSMNNPIYYQETSDSMPSHLRFDPRRMELREYLYRPSHRFAHGPHLDLDEKNLASDQMRNCESCHNAQDTHDWLPYRTRHLAAVSCEACHIPRLYGPTRQSMDWSFLQPDRTPREEFRGLNGLDMVRQISKGYEPALLFRDDKDGGTRLSPYNLVATWFWTYGNPPRPVRLYDLEQALFEGDTYHPDILAALDENENGTLEAEEALLNTPEKSEAVRKRLEAQGLDHLVLTSEIRAHGIHHNVASHGWAVRDCASCHSSDSRIYQSMILSEKDPHGSEPAIQPQSGVHFEGKITRDDIGRLLYQPTPQSRGLFILGHDSAEWASRTGQIFFAMILFGITAHGAGRYVAYRRRPPHHEVEATVRTELYTGYQRFWHWTQALAIMGLIGTGLVIHMPDAFGGAVFARMVIIHNILGFILLFNAFFSLFYHFASEKIRQYLPEPEGFFHQIVEQLIYYMKGIFTGAPHPFEKSRDRKLNPLQRITYLAILNILLPLQIVTGFLVWGAQHWPVLTEGLGGLGLLIPIHSFGAWLFAGFLVMHIYLTTTGHTVLSNMKAMITGWEEIPSPAKADSEAKD